MERATLLSFLQQLPSYHGRNYTEHPERVDDVLASANAFRDHLTTHYDGVAMEQAPLEAWQSFRYDHARNDAWHLMLVCAFLGDERKDVHGWLESRDALRYFANKEVLTALREVADKETRYVFKHAGYRLASELLAAGATPPQRQALADSTSQPLETIELLVDACDLCRMLGMSGIMLRRCIAMGYRRMADIRRADPDALRRQLAEHLEASGERSNHMVDIGWFVQQAQWLPDAVQ
ncbi:MAG: DUF4332 domain-containing protein [Anaerolineae bacterium]